MVLGIFLIALLIALNAFFVAAEFAIIKVRYTSVEREAEAGSSIAQTSQKILDRLDAYLSAAQIGITLASLALGWIGEPIVADIIVATMHAIGLPISDLLAHQIALPIGFVAITILHLIFGEAVPKYAAIYYPQELTYFCAIPLKFFAAMTAPLVWIINSGTWLVLAPFGIKVESDHDTHTELELRMLLAASAQSGELGSIQKTEHEMIEKVFSFDERLVRQIMVPRTQMACVALEENSEQVLDTVAKEGYSRMPVFSGSRDTIVGVVHSKELLRKFMEKQSFKLADIMRPAYFVPETKKIRVLLRELQSKRNHMAIVVDEFGVTSGLVTLEDIVEEIVGEIQDEYDDESPAVEVRKEGDFIVNAHASILDVNSFLPKPLPESPEYSTVAGLLNVLFSGIPEVGQSCSECGYEFRIIKRSRGSVGSVLLIPL
ncbi:MAG: hemolysin family protein [Proteobacteria bacterium]|nr:hemolysin family protein [Pseudomonadota bacterium]